MMTKFIWRSIIIHIHILVLGIGYVFCQNSSRPEQQVIPPSPVAGELAKYITYPVDLSNGLVKISIPLYEIVDGDIKIPITLDYHASGLKANVRSNDWIGDGWSLNTGPSVSRTINGGPDELTYYYDMLQSTQPTYQQLNTVVNQEKDITLDEFHYSLLNSSGRLYFKRISSTQLKPITIPVDSIRISLPVANNYTNLINITDTKGLQYSFGGTTSGFRDLAGVSYGLPYSNVPTAWKINKIYSVMTNRAVTFEYTSPLLEIPFYRTVDDVTMVDDLHCLCKLGLPAVAVTNSSGYDYYTYNSSTSQLELTNLSNLDLPDGYQFPMQGVQTLNQYNSYIKTIRFTGGYVAFTKNEGGKKGLTSIRVYDENDVLVREIEFNQGVIGSPAVLTLRDIKIKSLQNSEIEQYSFEYNNGVFLNKETRSIDKWGYYNGANNQTLTPTINTQATLSNYPNQSPIISITIPGGDREPNETFMKEGMLTGIVYPTGGRTNFVYEAHRYQDNGSLKLAGGLRIKQVQNVESSGKIIYHNYSYSTEPNSINGAGLLNVVETGNSYPPIDNFYHYTETDCKYFLDGGTLLYTYKERRWAENSLINLFGENGSSVSYPYVTETVSSDAAGSSVLGKTSYVFDIFPSYPLKYQNTNIVLDAKEGWRSGNPNSSTILKGTANSFDTVLHKGFSHTVDLNYGDESNRIRQYYAYKSVRIYGVDEDLVNDSYKKIEFAYIDISNGRNLLTRQSEDSYTSKGIVKKQTDYSYDTYGNVNREISTTSDGAKQVTVRTFTHDYPAGTSFIDNMRSQHLISYPVEEVTYRETGTTNTILSGSITKYLPGGRGLTDQIMKLETKAPIALSSFKFSNRATGVLPPTGNATAFVPYTGYKTVLEYGNHYDYYGNPSQVTPMDGLPTSYLWGYNMQYPIAEVKNSGSEQISYVDVDRNGYVVGNLINSMPIDFEVSTDSEFGYAIDLGYLIGYIWTELDLEANRPYQLVYWDNNSDLEIDNSHTVISSSILQERGDWKLRRIVFKCNSSEQLLFTANNGFIKRLAVYPEDAQMTTYTYDPLVGMTSSTDAAGRTTYYEYDGFGRLQTVSDPEKQPVQRYDYHYQGQ